MWFVEPGNLIAILAHSVRLADAKVELESVAANHFFLAVIGVAETARNHASDMSGRFEQGGLHPFTGGGHRGYRATRSSAVNNHVERLSGAMDGGDGKEEKRETTDLRHQFRLNQPRATPRKRRCRFLALNPFQPRI